MSTAPLTPATPIPPPNPVVIGAKPTPAQLRAEVERAENAFKHHLSGLRSEMTLADVNVDGMPLFDHVRERPLFVVGVTAALAAALPVLIGLLRRERPAPDRPAQWWDAYVADLIDDAAYRVQRGETSDAAFRRALRKRAPVIYVEPAPPSTPSALRSSTASAMSTVINTGLGFGLKYAMDRLAKELTGHPELFKAMDNEPTPERG